MKAYASNNYLVMSDYEDDNMAGFDEEDLGGETIEDELVIDEKTPVPSGKATPIVIEEPPKNADYKYEVVSRSEVLSMLKSKVLDLQRKFDFAEIDKGVFIDSLR